MSVLGSFASQVPGQRIPSAVWNTNFNAIRDWANTFALMTDVPRTVTVTHAYSASQAFAGGWTANAACTITAGGLTITSGVFNVNVIAAVSGSFSSTLTALNGFATNFITAPDGVELTLQGPAGRIVQIKTNATNVMYWDVGGNLKCNTPDLIDVGDGTTGRFRHGYFGGQLVAGLGNGGETVSLRPGAADHTYVSWYARTATPTLRSGWMGYGSPASTTLTLMNELNGELVLGTNSTQRWRLTAAGHLWAYTDNLYDLGAPANNRFRNAYIAGLMTVGGSMTVTGTLTVGALSFPSLTLSAALVVGTTATIPSFLGTPNFVSGWTVTADRQTVTTNGQIVTLNPAVPCATVIAGTAGGNAVTVTQNGVPAFDCEFSVLIKAHASAPHGAFTWPANWRFSAFGFVNPPAGKNITHRFRWSAADATAYEVHHPSQYVTN